MRRQRDATGWTAEGLARWHRRWNLGLRLLLGIVGTWLCWRLHGPLTPLLVSLLWARALLPELRLVVSWAYLGIQQLALRDVEGRHYNFRGQTIRVHDNPEEPCRWIAVADLELCLGEPLGRLASDARRQGALRTFNAQVCVLDDTVLKHLAARRARPRAVALHRWIQREIWFPARGRKANGGADSRQHPRLGFSRPSSTQ